MSPFDVNSSSVGSSRRRSLNELGLRNETDKASSQHTYYGRTYLDVYELYFEALRDRSINVLELGILNAGSLRTWRQYFANATVIGIDINPATKRFQTDDIRVEILSQDDAVGIGRLAEEVSGFDIVLDDASHVNTLTIRSFEIIWPLVRSGGYYIIEDVGCSYSPAQRNWPGMSITAELGVSLDNKREDFDAFIVRTLRSMDQTKNDMMFFHYYRSTIVMRKKVA